MTDKINLKKRSALIHDLIHADFDITAIQSKYGLTPDSLSQWVKQDDNYRCLTGLCILADIQTQILLSRYRLIAAGKLYELVTREHDNTKAEQDITRRACVDLLKLELRRADIDLTQAAGARDQPARDGLQALHALLLGPNTEDSADARDPDQEQADPSDG